MTEAPTPTTLEILEAASGGSVRKYRGENQGVIGARSSAAGQAKGEILVFLDPDDSLEPTYLEKVMLAFARFPSIDVVAPAVRVDSESLPEEYWYPAAFDERRLAYENTTPISSAMRRAVWDATGGMPKEMADGFEDWGFWRAAAGAGFQGWQLHEALFRYTYSEVSGRDASARRKRDDLERILKQLNPSMSHRPSPPTEDITALQEEINTRVYHFPYSEKRSLVVFVPWMLHGGGAETFLASALTALKKDFDIVIIANHILPPGHENATNEFLKITPYVYDLGPLVGQGAAMYDMVQSILYRVRGPAILVMGSPWAYEHLIDIKRMPRGLGRVIDIQFNHIGHLPELMDVLSEVDQVLVAHKRLQSLLLDYFEVPTPVDVLYIAPPEHDIGKYRVRHSDGRLRIGWLGRNSPEKRPDLVATIAAALPEADFLMAGSALEDLPPQPENVEVVGWVKDALQFLSGLDFILNTSDIEGVSVTAMEALRLGVPVLTRNVGGMAELVRDGENGLIYDIEHITSLAENLRNADITSRLRSTAQMERLPKEFHFDTMVDALRAALMGESELVTPEFASIHSEA